MTRNAGRVALLCALLALGACAVAPKPIGSDIVVLLNAGKLEEGVQRLEEDLRKYPGRIETRVLLSRTRMQLADRLLSQAEKDMEREAWEEAQDKVNRATALGAIDQAKVVMQRLETARTQAQLRFKVSEQWAAGKNDEARESLHILMAQDPQNPPHPKDTLLLKKVGEIAHPAPRVSVLNQAFRKKISLQLRDAPLHAVFDALAHSSGINFVFDKDVAPGMKTTLYLQDTTIESALRNVMMTTQLQYRVVDDHTLLIYQNDPAKQREYQQLNFRSFHIVNAEAKQVANSLKTLLRTRDLVVDEKLNMIVMRDTPETILMAENLVALHDVADPEVMLEVEILEIQRSDLESLGTQWPSSVALTPLGTNSINLDGSISTQALTLRDLTRINGGKIGVSVDSLKLSAAVNHESVSVLANPRIRIKSREKALIKVGERVPSVSSNLTSTGVSSQSVNYIDVGLKLEAEPVVYLDGEISIKLSLEVSSILETVVDRNNQPYGYRIGASNASTVLRLKDGENQILAGLISDNDKVSTSAVPLLGEFPILNRLFGSKNGNHSKTEIVLSITPRLVRNQQRPSSAGVEFDGGTDASLRGRDNSTTPTQSAPASPTPALTVQPPEKTGG